MDTPEQSQQQQNHATGVASKGSQIVYSLNNQTAATPHHFPYWQAQLVHHQQLKQPVYLQQRQQLQLLMASQMEEIQQISDFKNLSMPVGRIKTIMKADEDVRMIAVEAPIVLAKACEMFCLHLTMRSFFHAEKDNRTILKKIDIAAAIHTNEVFDFLIDIFQRDGLIEKGRELQKPTIPIRGFPDYTPYIYAPPQHPLKPPRMIMGKSSVDTATLYSTRHPKPPIPISFMPRPYAQPLQQQPQQERESDPLMPWLYAQPLQKQPRQEEESDLLMAWLYAQSPQQNAQQEEESDPLMPWLSAQPPQQNAQQQEESDPLMPWLSAQPSQQNAQQEEESDPLMSLLFAQPPQQQPQQEEEFDMSWLFAQPPQQ